MSERHWCIEGEERMVYVYVMGGMGVFTVMMLDADPSTSKEDERSVVCVYLCMGWGWNSHAYV